MKNLQKLVFVLAFMAAFFTVKAQSPDDYIVHTIKKGEILPVLAKKYGITVEDIAKLNNFSVNHVLHVGDKVKLPGNAVYRGVPDSTIAAKPAPVEEAAKEVASQPADTTAKPKPA